MYAREKTVSRLIFYDYSSILFLMERVKKRKDMGNYIFPFVSTFGLVIYESLKLIDKMGASEKIGFEQNEEFSKFYEKLRLNTKFYEKSLCDVNSCLKNKYDYMSNYFYNLVVKFLRPFGIHYRYGVTFLLKDGKEIPVSNTINSAVMLPNFSLDDNYIQYLVKNFKYAGELLATLLGEDIVKSKNLLTIDKDTKFRDKDYGYFRKSNFSINYNENFILFNLICNINFILYGLNKLILEDIPIKLRATYILYYYLCSINSAINNYFNSTFNIDNRYSDRIVRNALAHYGLYNALGDDIIEDDLFGGLTNKYFNLNWIELLKELNVILLDYRDQILFYLEKNKIQII